MNLVSNDPPARPPSRRSWRCVARPLGIALAAAAAVAIAGCASQGPPVHLHSLMAIDVPARIATAAVIATPVLLDVRLPAQVDQPQWLVRLPDGSLQSLEQERWAAPLHDEIRQALLEQLAAANIVDARSGVGGAAVRVVLDLRRFDSIPGREALLEGAWIIAPSAAGAPAARCDFLYREPAAGPISTLAAAHRKAMARLAAAIADGVLAVGRNPPVACASSDRR